MTTLLVPRLPCIPDLQFPYQWGQASVEQPVLHLSTKHRHQGYLVVSWPQAPRSSLYSHLATGVSRQLVVASICHLNCLFKGASSVEPGNTPPFGLYSAFSVTNACGLVTARISFSKGNKNTQGSSLSFRILSGQSLNVSLHISLALLFLNIVLHRSMLNLDAMDLTGYSRYAHPV